MARYVCYFPASSTEPYHLTCGSLARSILDYTNKVPPGAALQALHVDELTEALGANEPRAPDGAPVAAPAATSREIPPDFPGLWAQAAELPWALRSDRGITDAQLGASIGALRASGKLGLVRSAFRRLMSFLVEAFPLLATLEAGELAHLVALGRDMATAAGQSADLLAFVKSEAQPAQLAVWLDL